MTRDERDSPHSNDGDDRDEIPRVRGVSIEEFARMSEERGNPIVSVKLNPWSSPWPRGRRRKPSQPPPGFTSEEWDVLTADPEEDPVELPPLDERDDETDV